MALKSKYERVRNSIESHNLHFSNEFIHINAFIEIAKDTLSKKLMGILDTATCQILGKNWQRRLKHWKDTVITSNNQQARLNVCMKLLKTHITSLNIPINNDQNELKAK